MSWEFRPFRPVVPSTKQITYSGGGIKNEAEQDDRVRLQSIELQLAATRGNDDTRGSS